RQPSRPPGASWARSGPGSDRRPCPHPRAPPTVSVCCTTDRTPSRPSDAGTTNPRTGRQRGGLMREAVIVDAIRTPIGRGKPGGALSGWHPADLLGEVLKALVDRTGIDPAQIDDVITGCVSQAGEQAFNIARHGVLAAGFPESVP